MSKKIDKIFTDVAKGYDRVNTVSSLGIIKLWRKDAASQAMIGKQSYKLLDIATGTGELPLEILRLAGKRGKEISITAMDFNKNMLSVAKGKAKRLGLNIAIERGDAMKLRYPDNSFDVVTSTFALRNVDSLEKFASEARRVLKPGGKFVFMDMGRPDTPLNRAVIRAYWGAISWIGALEDKNAFDWLVYSTSRFDKANFVRVLKEAGFKNIRLGNEITGAAFIVTGNK